MQDNRLNDVRPQHDRAGDEAGRLAALRRYEILDTAEEEPFQRIVELVCQILDVPMAAVTLIDADRQWVKAASGVSRGSTPLDISFCRHTIAQSEPLSVPDAQYDPRFAANPTVTGGPRIASYLGVPLTTPDGYNVGALCAVDRDPRQFDARQASILKKLAEIVVEQMELRQIAKHDALTGALTRRGFLAEVEREFQRSARYDRPSAMIAIDIDHFRAINDRHGHAAGDAVLVSIASACMASMRKSDVFGRVGGEEFAMLLPETSIEDARDVAERLRQTHRSHHRRNPRRLAARHRQLRRRPDARGRRRLRRLARRGRYRALRSQAVRPQPRRRRQAPPSRAAAHRRRPPASQPALRLARTANPVLAEPQRRYSSVGRAPDL